MSSPSTYSAESHTTYLLIDGENLDSTLGGMLGRRPSPDERPRWNKVVEFAETLWAQPVKPLFFINASHGELPMPFLQALIAMHLRPVLLRGPADVKVVDVGIQRTMQAIVEREGDVLLGSHDGDFLPQVAALLDGRRRVGVLGFREYLNARYADLVGRGLELCDLEDAVGVFTYQLPRMRVIDIDEFDPVVFL